MTKKITRIILICVLSLVVATEIGYIISKNVRKTDNSEATEQTTPEPLPVVGEADSSKNDSDSSEAQIIVVDGGHGKPSTLMTESEKEKSGWVKNSNGAWGEWRHYKRGSSVENCMGNGCSGRVPQNGDCWYPIGNTDRNTEPEINLAIARAVQTYLEDEGYTVRMTRTTNDENPSISKRLSYCYPDNNPTMMPEAEVYVSIHSNASGGKSRGSAYVKAENPYNQAWIDDKYAQHSNELGKLCNDSIVVSTSLEYHNNGEITGEPELIALCKSPVPCGYLEIGFFDNSSDLSILKSESDKIGKAIAKGVDEFCKTH